MHSKTFLLAFSIFISPLVIGAFPTGPVDQYQEYKLETYIKDGDAHTLVLRFRPINGISNRQPRQEDEDDDDTTQPSVPATTPYIPAIIPGLTKIFTGIITGNLNDIFHGSSSFAPQNVSHAIDSVYNQVVGLPPPVATSPATRRPAPGQIQVAPVAPETSNVEQAPAAPEASSVAQAPAVAAPETDASSSGSSGVNAGEPLATEATVVTEETPTTTKATSNEDDEDESAFQNIDFRFQRRQP